MKKQPHLDRRAMHAFYGSQTNYIVLLLLSLPLLYSVLSFFRELYRVAQSRVVEAAIQYNLSSLAVMGDRNAPVLSFSDPIYGEQRYAVYDPSILSLIQNHPELPSLMIRYSMQKSGDISYLHLNNFWGIWGEALAFLLLSVVLVVLMIQLSPGPAWYWKNIDRRLAMLSTRYYQVELNVKKLEDLGTVFATGQRVCRLYAEYYLHTQNMFIEISSPKFLVESDFRMTYPLFDVYLNLKKTNRYEVDLKKFLKQNGSTLHGYSEKDREHSVQENRQSVG